MHFSITPGFQYEVSNLGRIRRFFANYYGRGPFHKLKSFRLCAGDEYLRVKISVDGRAKRLAVAHLVAHSFIGPRPDDLQINHKNGDKLDNRLENLEYVTRSENVRHAVRELGAFSGGKNGWRTKGAGPHLHHMGENHRRAKLTEQDVRNIRAAAQGDVNISALARQYGVLRNNIYAVINRKIWAHIED